MRDLQKSRRVRSGRFDGIRNAGIDSRSRQRNPNIDSPDEGVEVMASEVQSDAIQKRSFLLTKIIGAGFKKSGELLE
jgi:hypothetical protein